MASKQDNTFPDLTEKEELVKKTRGNIVTKRISGVYRLKGLYYVKIRGDDSVKWRSHVGDLQDTYTISISEFNELKDV